MRRALLATQTPGERRSAVCARRLPYLFQEGMALSSWTLGDVSFRRGKTCFELFAQLDTASVPHTDVMVNTHCKCSNTVRYGDGETWGARQCTILGKSGQGRSVWCASVLTGWHVRALPVVAGLYAPQAGARRPCAQRSAACQICNIVRISLIKSSGNTGF